MMVEFFTAGCTKKFFKTLKKIKQIFVDFLFHSFIPKKTLTKKKSSKIWQIKKKLYNSTVIKKEYVTFWDELDQYKLDFVYNLKFSKTPGLISYKLRLCTKSAKRSYRPWILFQGLFYLKKDVALKHSAPLIKGGRGNFSSELTPGSMNRRWDLFIAPLIKGGWGDFFSRVDPK